MLAVNAWNEPKADLAKFVAAQKLKQRVLLNGGNAAKAFKVKAVPTAFWIDRDGVIMDSEVGFGGPESLKQKNDLLIAS